MTDPPKASVHDSKANAADKSPPVGRWTLALGHALNALAKLAAAALRWGQTASPFVVRLWHWAMGLLRFATWRVLVVGPLAAVMLVLDAKDWAGYVHEAACAASRARRALERSTRKDRQPSRRHHLAPRPESLASSHLVSPEQF